jgi:hypothetical protein
MFWKKASTLDSIGQVQNLRFLRTAAAGVLKPRHFLGVELMAPDEVYFAAPMTMAA